MDKTSTVTKTSNKKPDTVRKIVSVICCIIPILGALYGLMGGINSIHADGMAQLGVIFIWPSVIALAVILIDLLITFDVIKGGLFFSFASSAAKIVFAALLIPSLLYSIRQEMIHNMSNLTFDLILIATLLMAAVPSVLNFIRRAKAAKNKNK